LTTAQIGTDNSTPARAIGAQHQNFKSDRQGNSDKADRCGSGATARVRRALP
jgi:hypothetical protein